VTAVPPEAITAAAEAMHNLGCDGFCCGFTCTGKPFESELDEAAAALEAAAPLIAAAERERVIQLASRLRAVFPADEPPGAMASFADYLRVQADTP
jgi:hypothetical protein